jgi:general secretion pathway protein M
VSVRERLEKLDPRERRLLGVLMGIFGVFLLLAGPIAMWSYVNGKHNENQDVRDLIDQIYEARGQISRRKARRDALVARYARPAPALAGFIDETAKANGVPTTAESQDLPEVPHGKRYTERSTKVRIHKVGMRALAETLEKIEQSGYPVAVTRLNLKPRIGEPDSYEVELVVSAYDRKADAPAAAGSAGSASSAAPATSASPDSNKEKDL